MSSKYQTLSGFLISPFNGREDLSRDTEYDTKYRQFVQSNSIKLHAMCKIDDSFYLHIKVPSESQKGNYEYDVVLRFFTDKPEVQKSSNLRGYYIQFFSNSPSFMYQYAYLYNKEGYLIEALYDKIDADYIDVPPEKTNSSMKKSYDKSIYFACRFLSEKRFRYLEKNGVVKMKQISPDKFFRGISDFKSVKVDQALMNEDKKLQKELDKKKKERNNNKHNSSLSSAKNVTSINYVVKKQGSKKVAKKVGSRSTFKK